MSVEKNKALIHTFYTAFQKRDAATMTTCYQAEAQFSDPVFGTLNRSELALMWQVLCRSAQDLRVEYQIQQVSEASANVFWQAWYSYGKGQRKVHNKVSTELVFKAGKILNQQDAFSLWKWASQAMGFNGYMIGWTKFFKNRLQQQSLEMLQRFLDKQKK